MKLELKKFDIRGLKCDAVVVFIGPRNTGKSTLLFDLLSYHCDIPVGVVISGTESANHAYERVCPKMLIYDEYSPQIIAKFLDRQRKISDQFYQERAKYGHSTIDPRAFLILDDCLYDNSWVNDKNMRYIFLNGRHLHIFFLLTMQFPLGIPPSMRANVDYVFINRNNMIKEREKIFHHYAGMFGNPMVFNEVMNQCTENFECLVIDKRSQSNELSKQVYWYKAKYSPTPTFKLCSKELWDMQAMDDERRALGLVDPPDDEEPYNPTVIKKNSVPITVRRTER